MGRSTSFTWVAPSRRAFLWTKADVVGPKEVNPNWAVTANSKEYVIEQVDRARLCEMARHIDKSPIIVRSSTSLCRDLNEGARDFAWRSEAVKQGIVLQMIVSKAFREYVSSCHSAEIFPSHHDDSIDLVPSMSMLWYILLVMLVTFACQLGRVCRLSSIAMLFCHFA